MSVPKDPVILLSYINTQLRDNYPSLEELCASLSVPEDEITKTLAGIGCTYDAATNRFA